MSSEQPPAWIDGRPNFQPVDSFHGLKAGDRMHVLWTEDAAPVPAVVKVTVAFGALVLVDPVDDPGWNCEPFEMYVTQQTPSGSWAR